MAFGAAAAVLLLQSFLVPVATAAPLYWDLVDPKVCSSNSSCAGTAVGRYECEVLRGCCFDAVKGACLGATPKCTDKASCSGHGECLANGTCKCDAGWTSYNCSQVKITTVHVVQSCHLDVGYKDLVTTVVNLYFDQHIPNMIKVGQELRSSGPEGWRLRFMGQAYYLSLYLDCPKGMGLHCPTAEQQEELRKAIAVGDITYHAFPHNPEYELATPEVVLEGIGVVHALDKTLGEEPKFTVSLRDVPGMTRSVIPVLRKAGVRAVNVGVNGASMYPRTPKTFRWVDRASGEEVYAMWHPRGYGGYTYDEAFIVPGLSHALVTDFNGDNAGPYTASDYRSHFEAIQKEFPEATIVASTFDNFTRLLDGVRDNIPVVEDEIGDTWIYGVPSDPKKVAMMRVIHREWSRYVREGGERDPVYMNATRLMIKCIEHTWGLHKIESLQKNSVWSNAAFEKARTAWPTRGDYGTLEQTWWEQRQWCVDYPLQALQDGGHPLYPRIAGGLKDLAPSHPDLSGYNVVPKDSWGRTFAFGDTSVAFNTTTGAVTVLRRNGKDYAGASNPLFLLNYTSYSQADYQAFLPEYSGLTDPPDWFKLDFGKPGDNVSQHKAWMGRLQAMWSREGSVVTKLVIGENNEATTEYGAPSEVWMVFEGKAGEVNVTLMMFNKTSTRLPESMFVMFNPVGKEEWAMDKLGEWVGTRETVDGGSKHLHAVQSGVRYGKGLTVEMTDSAVVNLGVPSGFPTPGDRFPDVEGFGVSSMLWNNLWGTNYVMWFPFNKDYSPVAGEGNLKFRYRVLVE